MTVSIQKGRVEVLALVGDNHYGLIDLNSIVQAKVHQNRLFLDLFPNK